MIRRIALFVGVLAIVWVPTMVCAQYSGAFGLSGLPSMPSMFGGSGKCGEAAACPGLGVPTAYFGWGIPQDRNTSVSLTAQNNGANNVREITMKLPTGGFWLGAALPVCLTENLSFVATGWYLFPQNTTTRGYQNYSYFVYVPPNGEVGHFVEYPQQIGNDWGTQFNWWFVDGAFAYTFGGPSYGGSAGSSGFSLLLGLRYDYYTVSLNGPDNLGGGPLFNNQDAGDVISRGWIPFVGFQVGYTSAVQSLKVRMLGMPTILGSSYVGLTTNNANRFEYNNVAYSGGHFYEVFGEFTRKVFGPSQAGVFARWNTARATSSDTGSIINNPALQDTYNFSLNRTSWTLGGLVTLDFNSPI